MASTATPYGFRPVNMLGGQVMTHGIRQYPIASGYATALCNGDAVVLAIGGVINKFTGTTTAAPGPAVGVFVGVSYTDPAMGFLTKNMWTAGTVTADAMAYVVDDPDALFEIQASGSLGQNAIGTNAALVQNAGNTTLGISHVALNAASIAATATLPVRIVDIVDKQGFSQVGDAFTDVIVRWNIHFNRTATGNAGA